MYAFILCVGYLVALASAVPVPCDIPQTFQTSFQGMFINTNHCTATSLSGDAFYDYPSQRVRIDETTQSKGVTITSTVWEFYKTNTGYYYDRAGTPTCYKYTLTSQMHPFTIPANSVYTGEFIIGSQVISGWQVPTADNTFFEGLVTVTQDSCFPVSQIGYNSTSGQVADSISMADFIPDVPDEVFDVPDSCLKNAVPVMVKQTPSSFSQLPFSRRPSKLTMQRI